MNNGVKNLYIFHGIEDTCHFVEANNLNIFYENNGHIGNILQLFYLFFLNK